MTKRTITVWWIAGLVAMVPGTILIPSSALALAAHLEPITPGTWNNFAPDDFSRTMVTLVVLGGLFGSAGIIVQMVAWIGALLNTGRLADRRWFNILLWAGIVGILTTPLFGVGALISGSALIAFVVGGPDATAAAQPTIPAKQTIKKLSNWSIVAMLSGTFFALLVSRATNPGGLLQGQLWPSLALESLGFTIVGLGVIAITVAWWGALFNTHRLADKTWFNLLIWSGIVGAVTSPLFGIGALIGLGVMIAYLRAGPDGTAAQQPQTAPPAAPPPTLAPTG